MPRQATGTIETHRWNDGRTVTFRARVSAHGRQWRIHFGANHEGWNQDRARVELDAILEKVKRGTWAPPSKRLQERDELDPYETVRVTAYRWWQRRKTELAPNTRLDYQWRLGHLVGHLGDEETRAMDARKVDNVRQKLVGQGLSARSVNMVLDLLAQVLDDAVEYKLLEANAARGKRRRMKVPRSRRSFLEPDMVVEAIRGAARLFPGRHAIVAYVWQPLAGLLLRSNLELLASMRQSASELDRSDAAEAAGRALGGAQLAEAAGLRASPLSVQDGPKVRRDWSTPRSAMTAL